MPMIKQVAGFVRAIFYPYGKSCGITPFVILFLPRTGSNFLAGKIDSHPQVMCHHEVLNPELPHPSQSVREGTVRISFGSTAERDAAPWRFLQILFCNRGRLANGNPNPVKAIGAKISHYDWPLVFLSILLNRRVKKIIVKRENVLASYVSEKQAIASGSWIYFKHMGQAKKAEPVYVDYDEFIKYERKRKVYYWVISAVGYLPAQKFFYIEYKEIKDAAAIRRLCEFIGVAGVAISTERTRKQADVPIVERIVNVEEMRQHFTNTNRIRYLLEGNG